MGSCLSCVRGSRNPQRRRRTRRVSTVENINVRIPSNEIEIDILPPLAHEIEANQETSSVEPLFAEAEEPGMSLPSGNGDTANGDATPTPPPHPRFIFLVIQRRNVTAGRPRFLVLVIDNSNSNALPQIGVENEEDHFHNIIDQLFRLAPVRAPPPTSAEYLASLPATKLTEELLSKNPRCVICCEDFSIGKDITLLPCGHCFDKECVETWLKEVDSY
jgi:hypothetical protein